MGREKSPTVGIYLSACLPACLPDRGVLVLVLVLMLVSTIPNVCFFLRCYLFPSR